MHLHRRHAREKAYFYSRRTGSIRTVPRKDRPLDFSDQAGMVTVETQESFSRYGESLSRALNWNCLFVLPPWIKAWWTIFHDDFSLFICAVWDRDDLIGIAPLMVQGREARLIGSGDVCDYLDFIVTPERTQDFFSILTAYLRKQGILRLALMPVRADSTVIRCLEGAAQNHGWKADVVPEDSTFEMDLPKTWEGYLELLPGKQRHELRRKLRRLEQAGAVTYQVVEGRPELENAFPLFVKQFRSNRPDKAAFMNSRMESYFSALAEELSESRIVKLGFLEFNSEPVASVMFCDYSFTRYLYNNGYEERFRDLNVGLLSKVLSIKDSIEQGYRTYEFLKGAEVYKKRLGGRPVQLYRCLIDLN